MFCVFDETDDKFNSDSVLLDVLVTLLVAYSSTNSNAVLRNSFSDFILGKNTFYSKSIFIFFK